MVDSDQNPLVPSAVATISPFESFSITESDMLPVIEPANAGAKKLGKPTSRRTRNSTACETLIPEGEKDSVRVMYEDPGLADERNKLMNLFKGQSREVPPKAGTPSGSARRGTRTRKSTKLA